MGLGLLMLELTDSPWWVALVGVMRVTPMLVFGMISGMIADRVERWHVMITSRSIKVIVTLALLVLIATDSIRDWHILLGTLSIGWAYALDLPSRHAFIYDLVGRENTTKAMSLESLNIPIGILVGSLLAGLFIELTGYTGTYVFVLLVYILALILISRIRSRIVRAPTTSQPILKSLATGLQYSVHNVPILSVLIITLIMNFLAFSAIPLFPAVARTHLEVGPGLTGVLISASGIGFLIGSAVIASRGNIKFHGRVFFLGTIGLFISVGLFAVSPWYLLSFVALLAYGLGLSGFATMQSTIVLMSSTPEMRGRTMGVLVLCIGAGPLGMLEVGGLATILNIQDAIGINAAAGLVLLLPAIFLTPLMWRPIATGAVETENRRHTIITTRRPHPDTDGQGTDTDTTIP